ncbi:MAG: RagB/SusD family nutrient uptake outer membrane protein [Bacteroides sp.]|nr:RagB/SusD family nutrient uptake outer membrane protein [Bacteroides sp.]
MKKIFHSIYAAAFSLIILAACDLTTRPTTSLDADSVFSTTEGGDKVLNGTWRYLLETWNSYANPGFGATLRANDAMGMDVAVNTNYGFRDHYVFTAIYGKGGTNSLSWSLAYSTINNVNGVIAYIDEAEGTDEDRRRIKAQAYGLRGFIYLHLASLYSFAIDKDPDAVCVPVYTEPSDASTEGKPASSVSEVYAQAIEDLEIALELIPQNYSRSSKHKIDEEVLLGLLSRATLYARQWEKARTYSSQLLEKNNYLMSESEYRSGFNDISNAEWIWGHPQTAEQSSPSYQFHYLDTTTPDSYYYSFNADPYFRDLFDDGDYRKSMIYWAPNPAITPDPTSDTAVEIWMRYAKFKFREGEGLLADIVLMRTSEIYLINAEAKARLNDPDAINVLNQLKAARGAQTLSGISGEALLEEIWIERRKELFGEGFSLVDIIRNQQTIVRNEYPSDEIDYLYTDDNGVEHLLKGNPKGHRQVYFPGGRPFEANSKYLLYRITDTEERENTNLYSKYPKLSIYNEED